MIDQDDIAYFNSRAIAERELSEQASCGEAKLIHLKLAERYERLAARGSSDRPTLHIVASQAG